MTMTTQEIMLRVEEAFADHDKALEMCREQRIIFQREMREINRGWGHRTYIWALVSMAYEAVGDQIIHSRCDMSTAKWAHAYIQRRLREAGVMDEAVGGLCAHHMRLFTVLGALAKMNDAKDAQRSE